VERSRSPQGGVLKLAGGIEKACPSRSRGVEERDFFGKIFEENCLTQRVLRPKEVSTNVAGGGERH